MDIPEDLRTFLAVPANLKLQLPGCQIQEAVFRSVGELTEESFTVGTADFAFQDQREGWDRMTHRKDVYRGVDLVKACKNYPPKGMMVWFPQVAAFGQWDSDHHKILIFPGATWTEIMRNPTIYFDAQWEPDRVEYEYLSPSE